MAQCVTGCTGYSAVVQTIAELNDPNRVHPLPADSYLAAGLQKAIDELNVPNLQFVLEVGQACDYPDNLCAHITHATCAISSLSLFQGAVRAR